MKKTFSVTINVISVLIITAFILYTTLWFYFAGRMQEQIDNIWTHQEKYLIDINGELVT